MVGGERQFMSGSKALNGLYRLHHRQPIRLDFYLKFVYTLINQSIN